MQDMKQRIITIGCASALLIMAACSKNPRLDISMSEKFEGQTVELINFLDSTSIATAVIENGNAVIELPEGEPVFSALLIDGRTRAFYITESGTAFVNDSTNAAVGTPLNDKFAALLTTLDSIEDLDDTPAYVDFARTAYNDNSGNPLGSYFGIEWIRYADRQTSDSLLATAPDGIKNSPKTQRYLQLASLRDATAPGKTYTDLDGEDADGNPVMLSAYVKPGNYNIVDFWASWCPYCIKEIPELIALYNDFAPLGLQIVGVAVRDSPEDSKAAINKHNIVWPVVFNTQRRPYDVYGFSGIPHHLLIGPDGTIISRGENVAQIRKRLEDLNIQDK